MNEPSTPPFTLTSPILHLVARIAEEIGRIGARMGTAMPPTLRRANRLRSIQASLAIENNNLSLEQVTAVVAGRRVLGPPQEIHEVRNAFAAYESMDSWQPWREDDLLTAHRLLMDGLVDAAGRYRTGGVGIAKGEAIVHLAPPASLVPGQMRDLLRWLQHTDTHPLVASCVFHYELEYIHPFADGNGRIGRLWQTLILSRWNPLFAWLPVESVVRDRQDLYYSVLASCDRLGQATPFIEFLLGALDDALQEAGTAKASTPPGTDLVSDPVSDQVNALLGCLANHTLSAAECMAKLGLSHRPTFRRNYLQPALAAGLIVRTRPDTPNSRFQKYRRPG